MAATIKIKNSSTASAIPTSSDLVQGELAVNVTDKRLFTENASGTVVELGTNPATLTVTAGATIQGLTVGRGAGAVSTNTAVGASALAGSNSGTGENVAIGYESLKVNTTGSRNTAVGLYAAGANTTGIKNVAVGNSAMDSNTSGSYNIAIGPEALHLNTTASNNTAVGYQASYSNTVNSNTTVGYQTGYSNTTGGVTAVGFAALYANTTGVANTAMGYRTLDANTTGGYNTAFGEEALGGNTTANNNTAVGYQAGYSTTGSYNQFFGDRAGYSVTTGTFNCFVGQAAGYYVTTGSRNTILGAYTGNAAALDIRTASNYIVLSDGDGNPRIWVQQNGGIFTGLGSVAPYNNTSASAANLIVFSDSSLGRSTSALKYKQDIRDVEDFDINLLRPVRYKSKCERDDQAKDHLGLIADEAAEAGFEELVTRNAEGEVEGFQYERLTVVLLKKLQTLDAEFKAYVAAHP